MTESSSNVEASRGRGVFFAILSWCIESRVVIAIATVLLVLAGLSVVPFAWDIPLLPRDRIAVDALPDIGENQQIVYTEWEGRSPRDVEDQLTYPLTSALLGISGVKTIRSSSAFGFSTIQIIFDEDVEFYWSRSRILEKLSSLPADTLPHGVAPSLGPDATGLGQVFWYTLEGRDPEGKTVGGWDQDELRAIQDFTVRYSLQAVDGVSEVASVGGFAREYQIDVDPEALRASNIPLSKVASVVRRSNLDIGARTLEINRVEYLVRGLGFIEGVEDLEDAVLSERDGSPIRIKDVARVSVGPQMRRGALDDEGAPAVGGVVVARYGENPLETIESLKKQIEKLSHGLPERTLADGTVSKVTIVPFYDRTTLIEETLKTLSNALLQALLFALLVVLLLLRNARSALLVAAMLPLGVLVSFLVMKVVGVDANIMALGGIAIAIGTMVDLGIVLVENTKRRIDEAQPDEDRLRTVASAGAEVAPAVLTSVLTTVVSFLPVLGLTSSEYKLFAPLALTKTIAMVVALLLSLTLLPVATHLVLRRKRDAEKSKKRTLRKFFVPVLFVALGLPLTSQWLPLGPEVGLLLNFLFVTCVVGGVLVVFSAFERLYPVFLATILRHKMAFLAVPLAILGLGGLSATKLGREYMPNFDEGSFLYMPTTMPHASLGQTLDQLSTIDARVAKIPEVDRVVGKLGRVDSALDPAPISMFETVITYHPEYTDNPDGTRTRNWRDHIRSPGDIWDEIARAAQLPGVTSAPILMPISARLVMLQSGMRAPMGLKVQGPDLETIQDFGFKVEEILKKVPGVRPETVFADRVMGKPYLELDINRDAIVRHGLTIVDVQEVLSVALGGAPLSYSVEGRERYPIRVRYARDDRSSVEALKNVYLSKPSGPPIPLSAVATIRMTRGPQMIKSEDTFSTSYVLFDKVRGDAEVEVVHRAQEAIQSAVSSGHLKVPEGVTFEFAGSYQNQIRSEERLMVLVPVALSIVFVLLYLQFRRASTVAIIYTGVLVAMAGGFLTLRLYAQPWFLDFSVLGVDMKNLFHVAPMNLSVAVWVGFVALIGLATDDGVLMSAHIESEFRRTKPDSIQAIHRTILAAGSRRIRPCLMTTATTLLALLPVVTSRGRGADLMVPMVLPTLGGMTIALITLFVVPTLTSAREEYQLRQQVAR